MEKIVLLQKLTFCLNFATILNKFLLYIYYLPFSLIPRLFYSKLPSLIFPIKTTNAIGILPRIVYEVSISPRKDTAPVHEFTENTRKKQQHSNSVILVGVSSVSTEHFIL